VEAPDFSPGNKAENYLGFSPRGTAFSVRRRLVVLRLSTRSNNFNVILSEVRRFAARRRLHRGLAGNLHRVQARKGSGRGASAAASVWVRAVLRHL